MTCLRKLLFNKSTRLIVQQLILYLCKDPLVEQPALGFKFFDVPLTSKAPKKHKLLYDKDFYAASIFYIKNFYFEKIFGGRDGGRNIDVRVFGC